MHRPETASTLLGRERLAHHYESNIKVRRTFIDIDSPEDDDDEDDDRPPMVAVKSEPAMSIPASPLQAYLEGRGRWQRQYLESLEEIGEISADEQGADETPQNETKGINPPLESRKTEQSMGSALHDSGQCKPCAWYWRPQGCFNFAGCAHCHMCGPDALKKRKKVKKQGRKSGMPQQQERQPTGQQELMQETTHDESVLSALSDAPVPPGASQTFAPAAMAESVLARAHSHTPMAATPEALPIPFAPPHFPPPMYAPFVPGAFQFAPPR
eukprot:TRINITY_DN65883_c0_g1_i1.p1 TRINITY_DN65883_c0_g1~~TRINITY_DN65883_c0_g1_i1.p1  ORF type:complete len:270 (-),score=48.82 TRINITY_DN65883_c0_g1_i1:233-1042(-)